jgi:serine/tyrosine/threonine adenylyltransferase
MSTSPFSTVKKPGWQFDNTYARLPDIFYKPITPTPVANPKIAWFNYALAEELGLDSDYMGSQAGASILSGNVLPEGSTPIAQAYAGHQFGHFTMLGDGRAILLGEHITPKGQRIDIQLKGAGPTPFSRRGDGRATLSSMLREALVSEAMHALGIPTTRSLAVVTSGEPVFRESVFPGSILTRVASSHIRVGTFEYIASQRNLAALQTLVHYTLKRHYPQQSETENPALTLLEAVISSQASLIAKWLRVGFIHGVMNTDNMALSGETIDYGPCAFMDRYNPATVFSSIDRDGRYAYGNQPTIAHWNIARFAETLIPLLAPDPETAMDIANHVLATFPQKFQHNWLAEMTAKLGFFSVEAGDEALLKTFLSLMETNQADYTNTFRALCLETLPEDPFFHSSDFSEWHQRWQTRVQQQPNPLEDCHQLMRSASPAVIPRNNKVEEALSAASNHGDFSVMQTLLNMLQTPYRDVLHQHADYTQPAPPDSPPYKTFCGT